MKRTDPNLIDMALLPHGTPSFATVLKQIEADTTLSDTRRRDLSSGLCRLARALGSTPEAVPADPRWLRTRLAKVMPAALGIARKSWQNAVSDARSALAQVGIVTRRQRHIDDLTAPWRELWRAVLASQDRTLIAGLCRFVHFLSAREIAPEAVTQADAEAFLAVLQADEIARRPEKGWRDALNAWNLAGERLEGWPAVRLAAPGRQGVITLAAAAAPPAFLADLTRHMDRLARPDPFADDGPTRPLRPATIRQQTRMLKRFASELLEAGVPAAEIDSVAALCDPVRAERGLRAMVARNGNRTNTVIDNMAGILLSHARKLRLDEEMCDRLAALYRRVALPPQTGMTRKNRARLRVLREERTLRRLLELPAQLLRTAHKRRPKAAALAREDALAIALLLLCPIRIRNLSGIRIDRNLQRPGDRRVFLVFEEEGEVKNDQPLAFELPPDLRKMLDRHLADRAPLLCPAGTPWLFPRRDGTGPIAESTFGTRLSNRIRKELGIAMNPHLFRHLAAMVWLDAKPGSYEAVRRLLGHSSVSRTIDLYSGMETRSALAAYGEVLATKRRIRP